MNAPLRFREYRPDDRLQLPLLLAHGRPAAYPDLKHAVFDWQFFGNPERGETSPFLIGEVGDRIVALNGFMPLRFRAGVSAGHAAWICDIFVAAEYRGQGFGKQLLRAACERFPVTIAYGISDMSDPILGKLGWTADPGLSTYFLPVNEPGIKGAVKHWLSRFHRAKPTARREASLDVSSDGVLESGEIDALWRSVAGGYCNAVQRTATYLDWKYRRHPLHSYRFFSARHAGRLRALLITRHSLNTSIIVDYVGPSDGANEMSSLICAAVAEHARAGTVRVRCETNHVPLQISLLKAGFFKSRYCSRFRSLDRSDSGRAGERWFLMSGDSDGDMIAYD